MTEMTTKVTFFRTAILASFESPGLFESRSGRLGDNHHVTLRQSTMPGAIHGSNIIIGGSAATSYKLQLPATSFGSIDLTEATPLIMTVAREEIRSLTLTVPPDRRRGTLTL